jgi:hypothetical protein
MRFGEIVNLTWTEVDFNRDAIFLSRLKPKVKKDSNNSNCTSLKAFTIDNEK